MLMLLVGMYALLFATCSQSIDLPMMIFASIMTGVGILQMLLFVSHCYCYFSLLRYVQRRRIGGECLDCLCCVRNSNRVSDCLCNNWMNVISSLGLLIFFAKDSQQSRMSALGMIMNICVIMYYLCVKCGQTRSRQLIFPLWSIIDDVEEQPAQLLSYTHVCEWHPSTPLPSSPSSECTKCICSFCLSSMNHTNVYSFAGCLHIFHTDCWKEYARSISREGEGVKCPICRKPVMMNSA